MGNPRISFRVGATGTRALAPPYGRLQSAASDVLRLIRTTVDQIAAPSSIPKGRLAPCITIVSPLAEGADRLVAQEALTYDFDLISPLPFAKAEYEKDFPASLAEFHALLSRATVIELTGERGDAESASYEAAGHFVVRNCDVLIAMWDGKVTGKRGGTAEITRWAAKVGVPVWWINTDIETPARWIASEADWIGRNTGTWPDARAPLDNLIRSVLNLHRED